MQTVLKMASSILLLKLFQFFLLLKSFATSTDEKTLFEKEMEIISKLIGYCPYCDPNFIDIPNLQSAMKGYDLPMGDPNRKLSLLGLSLIRGVLIQSCSIVAKNFTNYVFCHPQLEYPLLLSYSLSYS